MSPFDKRSLSFKLVLLFVLTAVLMVMIVRYSMNDSFKGYFQTAVRPHLNQYFDYINEDIGNPPNIQIASKLSQRLNLHIVIQGPDQRWSSTGDFPDFNDFRFHRHAENNREFEAGRSRGSFAIRITSGLYQTTFITKLNSSPPSLPGMFVGLLLVLALLYFLIRLMIKPVKDIQQSVKRIGSGELNHRIKVKRQDELGDLSVEVNAMADDIENMLEAKRQLLLAISHELRSPITRAKVALSLIPEDALKDGLEEDLNEMETMISNLLEAEIFNHRHQILHLELTDIDELIRGTVEQFYSEENIVLNLQNNASKVNIDQARMQFVIKNLISNALKYRKAEGDEICITSNTEDGWYNLVAKDSGKGIAAQHLPHLTEPFYRVDPSRQRDTGGYGLGLYVIDKIIVAHAGQMAIESTEQIGTTVTVKLPV